MHTRNGPDSGAALALEAAPTAVGPGLAARARATCVGEAAALALGTAYGRLLDFVSQCTHFGDPWAREAVVHAAREDQWADVHGDPLRNVGVVRAHGHVGRTL